MRKSLYILSAAIVVCAFLIIPIGKSFAASTYSITVKLRSDWPQGGYITSTPSGINCKSDCSHTYSSGTSVTLKANNYSGYRVATWWGVNCLNGNSNTTCDIPEQDNNSIGMLWEHKTVKLNISKTGNGSGTVTGSGINCGGDCSQSYSAEPYPSYNEITVKAAASNGSKFAGWQTSGDVCHNPGSKGTSSTVNTSKTCTAKLFGSVKDNSYVAVAKFTSTGGSSSGSTSGSTSEDTSSDSSSSSSDSTSTTEKDGSPKSPTVEKIKVGDDEVSTKDPIEVSSGEPLVLSGKTVPNGIVTLTIHSDPMTVTTEADKDGNWSYTITDLPAGDHYVEASVKDPKTKKTSKIGKLLSFTVVSADSPATTAATAAGDAAASSSKNWLIALPIVAIVLAAGGWFGWKWWKAHKTQPSV